MTGDTSLIRSANETAGQVRTQTIVLLGLEVFVLLVAATLTDEGVLRNRAVPLPIIDKTELPLSSFFALTPWIILVQVLYIYWQLGVLQRQLTHLRASQFGQLKKERVAEDLQLSSLPVMHWLARTESSPTQTIARLSIVYGLYVALPLLSILFSQLAFVRYQSEAVVWSQRLALAFTALTIVALWPMRHAYGRSDVRVVEPSTSDAATKWLRQFFYRISVRALPLAFGSISIFFSYIVIIAPLEQWEAHVAAIERRLGGTLSVADRFRCSWISNFFGAIVIYEPRRRGQQCIQQRAVGWLLNIPMYPADGMPLTFWTTLLFHTGVPFASRTLTVAESELTHTKLAFDQRIEVRRTADAVLSDPAQKYEAAASSGSKSVQQDKESLRGVNGLDLRERNLRFLRLENVTAARADFRSADLRGAKFSSADLREASLDQARMQGTTVFASSLRGASMRGSNLQGAHIERTDFSNAAMEDANLIGSVVLHSSFINTSLRGLNASNARLLSSDLRVRDDQPTLKAHSALIQFSSLSIVSRSEVGGDTNSRFAVVGVSVEEQEAVVAGEKESRVQFRAMSLSEVPSVDRFCATSPSVDCNSTPSAIWAIEFLSAGSDQLCGDRHGPSARAITNWDLVYLLLVNGERLVDQGLVVYGPRREAGSTTDSIESGLDMRVRNVTVKGEWVKSACPQFVRRR